MADTNADLHLDELRHREEEELASILSQKYGATYVDLSRVTINSDALRIIPEEAARDAEVAAFDLVGKKMSLAERSPANPKVALLKEELAKRILVRRLYGVSLVSRKCVGSIQGFVLCYRNQGRDDRHLIARLVKGDCLHTRARGHH